MEQQLRPGTVGQVSYIKRFFIFILIVSLMMMFVIQPKPARAFAVTPTAVAGFLVIAGLLGITFTGMSESSINSAVTSFLQSFYDSMVERYWT